MPPGPLRTIIDLEWPTRYVLDCGHAIPIAADASAVDMAMPGSTLPCPACGGAPADAVGPLARFKAGEAINAISLNDRFGQIERALAALGRPTAVARFTADEPINVATLNLRIDQINAALTDPS